MVKTKPVVTINRSFTIPINVWYAFTEAIPLGQRSSTLVDLMVAFLEKEGITLE